jgi:hypothetical protein
MKTVVLALGVLAIGCSMGAASQTQPDGSTSDSPGRCQITISTDPTDPPAAPATVVRATANDDQVGGVLTRNWKVTFEPNGANTNVDFTTLPPDGQQIEFLTPTAGDYHITLDDEPVFDCDQAPPLDVTAHDPQANVSVYRLQISPLPSANTPAQDKTIQVFGGGNATLPDFSLDAGIVAMGTVMSSSGAAIPAYLRFSSPGTRTPLIEAIAAADGTYTQRLRLAAYDVLVVPMVAGEPGQRFTGWMPGMPLKLDAGTSITGTVHGPTGAALANATVELHVDDVPTTVVTTQANGSFTAIGFPLANVNVEIVVTPPAGSPLPKLSGTSMAWNTLAPLTINYAANLATPVNVAGVHVHRQGAAAPNADVVIAGTIATGGTVNGTAIAGVVHVAATTNASGDLPAGTQAPAAVLSLVATVVVNIGGTPVPQLGVGAFDLTGTLPGTVDTGAPINAPGTVRDHTGATLDHVVIDATPSGALASAGGAVVHAITASNGTYNLSLASGGHYVVRMRDPAGRGAPLDLADVTAPTLPATSTLATALAISGSASTNGQPVVDASVQIMCTMCSGIDATRPLAEGSTDSSGLFTVAVADPGTM